MKISKILLFLYIGSIPIMKVPRIPVLEYKIQYSEIIFIILSLYIIWEILKGKRSLIKAPFLTPLIFLLGTFFISLIRCNPHIKEFMEYFGITYLALLYILIVLLVRSEVNWWGCINLWIWVSTFVCIIGIHGYIMASITGNPNILTPLLNPLSEIVFFPKIVQFQLRISSTFRNPNMLASYLITSTTFILLAIRRQIAEARKYKWYILILCLHLLTALLTKSRITGGTLLLVTLSLFIWSPLKKFTTLKIITSICAGFYLVLAFITLVIWVFPIQLNPLKINTKNSEYFLQSKAAFKMWKDYPFFGIGPGRYNYNLERYFDWDKAKESLPDPENPLWKTKDPHSTYLGWAAETGVLGLLAILIFLLFHVKAALQFDAIKIMGVGIIAFLIAGFSADILMMRHLWFLLGMNAVYVNLKVSSRSINGS